MLEKKLISSVSKHNLEETKNQEEAIFEIKPFFFASSYGNGKKDPDARNVTGPKIALRELSRNFNLQINSTVHSVL